MLDLERRIQASLHRRAGAPAPIAMPRGTTGAVRSRQGLVVAASAAGLGVLIGLVAVVGGAVVTGRPDPVEARNGMADQPLEQVPEGWPVVVLGDPTDGHMSIVESRPAVDEPRVLAYGTVDDERFSLAAWTVGNGPEGGPCLGFAGPGGDNHASPDPQPPGAWGGVVSGRCASSFEVPDGADLYVEGVTGDVEGLTANLGFVSGRVDAVVVRYEGGGAFQVPLLRGSEGWGQLRTFLFFPPEGLQGTVVALDLDGRELAHSDEICTYDMMNGAAGGCGPTVVQVAPVP
jgi:hypothetical protein